MKLMVYGLGLLIFSPQVFGDLPLAGGLNVPAVTRDTLRPVERGRIDHVASLFQAPEPTGIFAAVYCIPSRPGDRAIAVFISGKPEGKFSVIEYSISFNAVFEDLPEEPQITETILEPQLARRITALIRFELKRTPSKAMNDYVIIHGSDYYFRTPAEMGHAMLGTTDGGQIDSTIRRLCRAVDLLSGLPTINDVDRVRLIGELDRAVTAIEVAYNLAR